MKIILIYGGKSAEHEISILTAQAILKNLNYEKYNVQPVYITKEGVWIAGEELQTAPQADLPLAFETRSNEKVSNEAGIGVEVVPTDVLNSDTVVFPALHGPNGEDGTIQGLFETLNVPYVGANVLASATGMDKIISKYLFEKVGIPQLPYLGLTAYEWKESQATILEEITNHLGYPVFVKPANLGSSVGISEAKNEAEIIASISLALKFDRRVVIESALPNAREVELAVMGNETPQVSVPGELVKDRGFYDYDEKYINNKVKMAIPAELSTDLITKLQDFSKRAYMIIDGSGLTRCDFFVSENDEIFINEVNTMPGFTQFSMYPSLWEATGKTYKQLLEELLNLALERYEMKQTKQNQVSDK